MANLIRKIAAELTGFVISRLTAPRKKLRVPVIITLEPHRDGQPETLALKGETRDLSVSGIALIVPSIRLNEKYLVGENRKIYAALDLPNGRINVELIGCRYEQIDMHDSTANYLVGARIVAVSDADKALYREYLKHGDGLKNSMKEDFVVESSKI